jgi:predicted CoA-binding protein
MSTHPNLIDTPDGIREILTQSRTIAVLGIKTEAQSEQAAFYVPKYMQAAGYEIVPVPVYYPEATEILGRKVYRKLIDIPGPVDLVNVFRRPKDVPPHVHDILAKKPRAVWLQLGIRHDESALKLAEAGIKVVQDRCIMVDHRSMRHL